MTPRKGCRHAVSADDGLGVLCGRPTLEGAIFCDLHLDVRRQCAATKPGSAGKVRCRRLASPGLTVCKKHGGAFKHARAQSERAVVLTEMQRFARPYEGDMDPIAVFEREFRRTLGRIDWFEDQLSRLRTQDLIWGKTGHVTGFGPEGGIDQTTYAAQTHMFEEMLWRERKHLVELEKLWIGAKLDTAKLQLMRAYVVDAKRAILSVFTALGIDPTDPKNAALLERAFNPPPEIEV